MSISAKAVVAFDIPGSVTRPEEVTPTKVVTMVPAGGDTATARSPDLPTPVDHARLAQLVVEAGIASRFDWVVDGFIHGFDIGVENFSRHHHNMRGSAGRDEDGFPCGSSSHPSTSPTSPRPTMGAGDGFLCNPHHSFHELEYAYNIPDQVNKMGDNLKSAEEWPDVVKAKLTDELEAGRVVGPYDSPPFDDLVVSPIGVVPKKALGKYRMIHHLSYPKGGSVNDFIPQDNKTVFYPNVDTAVDIILDMGGDVWLAKTDIESAFRIVPVRPDCYRYLGLAVEGKYYIDRCLPMGCASSCKIFTGIGDCLVALFNKLVGTCKCVNVLDDFLFIGVGEQATRHSLEAFVALCQSIGVPIAPGKTEGPAKCLTFLGIELDTGANELRLPNDKLLQYIPELTAVAGLPKVRLRLAAQSGR